MNADSFGAFYQEELVAFRKDAYRFGKRHPEMADSLGLHWGDSPDPMVERLIEATAWFAARIRRDSEAGMPFAAQQILGRIHPHFTRPVPSMGIASLTPNDGFADAHPAGRILPAGARFHCAGAGGGVIHWRTGSPILLNGAKVISHDFGETKRPDGIVGGHSLSLVVENIRAMPSLRLFPWGNPFTTHPLHQWVHANALDVRIGEAGCPDGKRISLGRDAIQPGGLSPEELALPRDSFAHPAYQLLQEYFVCPDRFLFWDIDLSRCAERRERMEIAILLRLPPPDGVRADLVRFDACAVPMVNLFETLAEPVLVDHTRHSWPLESNRADPDASEVHSILEVEAIQPGGGSFVIPRHGADGGGDGKTKWRWYGRRRRRMTGYGSDVELFFKSPDAEDF
ncbi:MAG: type VI secretion system baseplate subunit TssF, partial [Planctomycetota bacterium]|nr:type VI secretion system baseplate subunit TssF [Planctomycetota bacterium]